MRLKSLSRFQKLFLITIFIFLFFCPANIIFATSDSATSESWGGIFNFFSNISKYFSKSYEINQESVRDRSAFTDYNQHDKDVTFRAFDNKERAYNKGAYINDVLEGTYQDRILAYACNNNCYTSKSKPPDQTCEEIKISTIAYYYYTKNIDILYDKNDNTKTISYPSKINSYNYNLVSNENCYVSLYEGLQIIPQGDLKGRQDAAPVSSKQLNNNLRTIVPESKQSKPGFWDKVVYIFVDNMAKDNEKQEKQMLSSLLPEKSKTSTNNDFLRKTFASNMHPASWQKTLSNRGSSSNDGGHQQGLSQYGAQGRALSNQDYETILQAYYGLDTKIKIIDTSNSSIQITPSNEWLDFETMYMRGIAEMPDSWEMEALKAQAVAARTYAYVRTQNFTKSICTDTYCQVYNPNHIFNSPRWTQAVEETKGQILVNSFTDTPFSTMYCAWHQGQSISYSSNGHSTASINDSRFEQLANAPY